MLSLATTTTSSTSTAATACTQSIHRDPMTTTTAATIPPFARPRCSTNMGLPKPRRIYFSVRLRWKSVRSMRTGLTILAISPAGKGIGPRGSA